MTEPSTNRLSAKPYPPEHVRAGAEVASAERKTGISSRPIRRCDGCCGSRFGSGKRKILEEGKTKSQFTIEGGRDLLTFMIHEKAQGENPWTDEDILGHVSVPQSHPNLTRNLLTRRATAPLPTHQTPPLTCQLSNL